MPTLFSKNLYTQLTRNGVNTGILNDYQRNPDDGKYKSIKGQMDKAVSLVDKATPRYKTVCEVSRQIENESQRSLPILSKELVGVIRASFTEKAGSYFRDCNSSNGASSIPTLPKLDDFLGKFSDYASGNLDNVLNREKSFNYYYLVLCARGFSKELNGLFNSIDSGVKKKRINGEELQLQAWKGKLREIAGKAQRRINWSIEKENIAWENNLQSRSVKLPLNQYCFGALFTAVQKLNIPTAKKNVLVTLLGRLKGHQFYEFNRTGGLGKELQNLSQDNLDDLLCSLVEFIGDQPHSDNDIKVFIGWGKEILLIRDEKLYSALDRVFGKGDLLVNILDEGLGNASLSLIENISMTLQGHQFVRGDKEVKIRNLVEQIDGVLRVVEGSIHDGVKYRNLSKEELKAIEERLRFYKAHLEAQIIKKRTFEESVDPATYIPDINIGLYIQSNMRSDIEFNRDFGNFLFVVTNYTISLSLFKECLKELLKT